MKVYTLLISIVAAALAVTAVCLKIDLDETRQQVQISHYAVEVLSHDVDAQNAAVKEWMNSYSVLFEDKQKVERQTQRWIDESTQRLRACQNQPRVMLGQ